MKNNINAVKIITVLLFGLIMPGMSFAQASYSDIRDSISSAEREMMEDKTQAAIEMGGNIKGIVTGINPSSGSLTVQDMQGAGRIYNISVKDSTVYFVAASISDIYAGDTVSIDVYSLDGYRVIAETIIIEKRAHKEEHFPPLEKSLVSD